MNLVHPSSYWTSTNPVLEPYQIGVETDTNQWKMGDGLTSWTDLTYAKFPFEYSIATGTDTYATTFGKGVFYTNEFIDYYVGLTLWVKFGSANTGAATLNINGIGAKGIKKSVTSALAAADIKAGGIYELVYDGTNFQINISSGGGSGDVVGPASSTADDIAVFNGTTGKLIKDGGSKISDLQLRSEKDASGGYAGLTLFKINFKNAANTFISFFTNSNTAARTYTFQDRNGTIADDTDLATKQATLTDVNFGSFNNGLTGKTTPVDADYTVLMDSVDSNKEKKLSFANLWTWVKSKIESVVLTLTNGTTATTQSANDNSTKVATTAYADSMALNKIDYWLQGVGATLNPADSTNYHFGLADATPATATANRRFKFAVGGTLKLAALTVLQANNGSNETVTVYIRNVTTATDTSIGTFTSDFGATTSATFNYSGLSIAVNNTDYYTLKIACPAWATNPSGWAMTCLLVIQ